MTSTTPATLDELGRLLARHLDSADLELPVLPDAAARVIDLCRSDDAGVRDLATVLERDQSLAAHVLRVSNSAAFAPEERIVSLPQAIGRLGMHNIRDICLSVALKARAFSVKGQEVRVKVLWTHSALSGAWAREIARARRRNVEGAFLCGLLHDVGKPVVLQAALDLARGSGAAPGDAHLARWMDAGHAAVGARLSQAWSLPAWMTEAVRFHHRAEEAGDALEMARTIRLADLLAHWTVAPSEAAEEALARDECVPGLNLYPDELEELQGRREAVLEVAGAWS
jgi:HD-like signal output (HDOD) protein